MTEADQIASKLAPQIKGRVVDAGDGEYVSTVRIDNGRISHEPTVVVVPVDIDDVAATVKFAAENQIRLTTRCGGHSATGYCLNSSGIVLDLRPLDQKQLDRGKRVLTLGMGNIWRSVYDYLETSQTGLTPIGGGCPGVGVGGFLLGGGFSFISRSYGLGSDNMLSLTVVKADGTIETIDSKNNPDLFWAMRGSGGGNFAVAVEAQLQVYATPSESMLMGQVFFPFYRIEEVLAFYNEWEATLPDEMAVYGYLGYQADPRNPGVPILTVRFTPVYNGPFAKGVELLSPLFQLNPIRAELFDMTIPEWEDFIGGGTQVQGRSAYIRSLTTPPGSMNSDVARVCMKFMTRAPSLASFVVFTHLGGAVQKKFGDADGSFAHRSTRFIPEVKSIWDSSKPHEMRRNVEWAYAFYEELAGAAGATGAYLNYIDPLLVDWDKKYYGDNYERLKAIKAAEDPNNFFGFQQSIGSSFNPKPPSGGWHDLSPLGRTFA